jgi:outer membrane lipoprotein-sorting protein
MLRILVLLVMLALPLSASAMTAEEIMKSSQAAFLYPGKDFKARVAMKLTSKSGSVRTRELTMLRRNQGEAGGDQKYFMYFHQPADVKGMAFLVYKYPVKDDDRWLFVPALNMVRRIAAADKRSSFVGSDFTYEDVSGRDVSDDAHETLREEKLGSADAYVIKSTPKAGGADFGHKTSWIDKATLLPLKEEFYDKKGVPYKVFTADEIKDIKGVATIVKRTMKNLQSGHSTESVFDRVDYNVGMEDAVFTERYLKQPPRKWME